MSEDNKFRAMVSARMIQAGLNERDAERVVQADLANRVHAAESEAKRLRARDAEYKQLTEDWARVERKCETVSKINAKLEAENAELCRQLAESKQIADVEANIAATGRSNEW